MLNFDDIEKKTKLIALHLWSLAPGSMLTCVSSGVEYDGEPFSLARVASYYWVIPCTDKPVDPLDPPRVIVTREGDEIWIGGDPDEPDYDKFAVSIDDPDALEKLAAEFVPLLERVKEQWLTSDADEPNLDMEMIEAAKALSEAEELDEALVAWNKIIEAWPKESGPYGFRADIFIKHGLWHAALADIERLLAIDRDDAEAWVSRSYCHHHLGNIAAALADAKRAAELAPENDACQQQLANVRAAIHGTGDSRPGDNTDEAV